MQANVFMPQISNPVLEVNFFTRHWDQDKYSHFRDMFDLYNSKINEAFDAKDHNTSVRKWRELFCDNFGELKNDNGNKGSAPIIVSPPNSTQGNLP